MTAIIVQARLDSSRLPGKALLPLGTEGKPLIAHVLAALGTIRAEARVLAVPAECAADFENAAREARWTLFAGEKEDVLARYCGAIRFLGFDKRGDERVIRATGDNPFVFADAAAALNDEAAALGADYAAYAGLPYGAGVESVRAAALLRAETEAHTAAEREHVCPYIYAHGAGEAPLFALHRPLAPKKWRFAALRLTVDTAADYENACRLALALETEAAPEKYHGETIIATRRRAF